MSLNELKQSPFDNKTIIILMVVIIVVLALDVLVRMDVINTSSLQRSSDKVSNSESEEPPPLPELQSSIRVFEVLEKDPENPELFFVSELDSEAKTSKGPVYEIQDEELEGSGINLFISSSVASESNRSDIQEGSILEVEEYFVAQNGVVVNSFALFPPNVE